MLHKKLHNSLATSKRTISFYNEFVKHFSFTKCSVENSFMLYIYIITFILQVFLPTYIKYKFRFNNIWKKYSSSLLYKTFKKESSTLFIYTYYGVQFFRNKIWSLFYLNFFVEKTCLLKDFFCWKITIFSSKAWQILLI